MIKKRKKLSVIGSLALIFALAVSGGACGKEEEKDPPLPEQESAGGYTIQYDLPEDGSLPSEHTGIENIGYLAKNLLGRENYSVDMTSSVSALGGLYEQKIESYKDYRDGVLIATDIATSSLVNTATQCCFIGESVFMRGAKSNKVKDWKGRETEFSTADPQHYALSAYMQTYGLSSKEFSVYILNADTVVSSSEAEKLPDGNYSQTFTLDTVEAASFYRVRMKTMGALAALPEMQSITATFTFDEAWNLLSTRYVEKYNIQKGPLSLSCTADTTSVYRYGEADISAYENFFSRYETVTKPDPDVIPVAPERGVADYLSDAFSSLLIEETAFDLALQVGETERQAHLSLDITDGVSLKADLGEMKIAYLDNKLHLKRFDLQGYIDAQGFLSKLSPDAGAAQAEETESALSSLDLDSLLEQLSEGEFIKNEDGSARLKSELTLGSLTLPLEISFTEQEGVAYLKDLKTTFALDGTEIFVTLLPSEKIAGNEEYLTEKNLTPYADYIFDYILDKSFALDLKYSSGDISFAGELNYTDGCLRLDLSAKAMGATADVTAYLKEEKIYLTLHTLNGRAFEKNYCVETNSVSELIGALTPEGEEGGLKIGKLVEALLSFDLDRNIRFYPDDFGVLTSLWLDDLSSALSLPVSLGKGDIRFYEGGLRGSFGPISFRLLPGKEVSLPEAAYTSLDNLILDSKEFLRFVTNEELALTLSATLQGREVKAEILMGGNICGEGTLDDTPFVFVYGGSGITIAFPSAEATICVPLEILSGGDSSLSGIEIDLARLLDAFIDNFKKIEDDSCLLKFTTSLGGALGVDSLQLKVFDNRVKGWISHFGLMGIWGENVLFELKGAEGKRIEIPSYLRYYHLTSSLGLTFEGDISGIRASAKAQIAFGEKTAILMAITLEEETATLREDRAKTLYAKFDGEQITLVLPRIGSEAGTLFTGTLDELSALFGDSLSGNISVNVGSLVAGLISSLRVEEEGRLSLSAFGVSLNCQIGSGNIAVNVSDIAREGLELRGVKIGVLPYRAVSVGYPSSTALAAYTKVTMQDILDIADIVTDESGVQISFSYDFISFTARVQEGEVTGFIETKNGLGEVENTILFRYDGEKIYLVVNGNTYLSATLDELLSLIRDIELTPSSGNVPAAYRAADEQTTQLSSVIDILKRLLSSDLSFIGISRGEENALQITLSVNELFTSVVGEEIDLLPKGTVLSLTAREGAVTGEIGKRTENDEIVVGDFSLAPVKNPAEPPAGEEPDEEPDKEPDPFIELDKTMSEALEGEGFASLDKLVASGIDKTVALLLSQNYCAELRATIDGIPVCADVLLRTDTFDLAAALTIGADKLHLNAVCGKQGARIAIQELNVLLTADENNLQELWDKLGINSLAGDMDTAQVVSAALGLLQKLTLDDEGGFAVDLRNFYQGLSVSGKIAKEDGSVLLTLGENFTLEGLPVSATLSLTSGEGKTISIPDTSNYTVVTYQDGKEIYDFVTKCISEGWKVSANVEGIDLFANYDQNGNIRVSVTAKAKAQTLTLVYDKTADRVAILTGNLRLSVGVEQVKAFVKSFLSQEETPTTAETVSQAVQTILSLDWEKITVTNDGQIVIQIAVNDLLQDFVTLKNCDLTVGATGKELTAKLTYEKLTLSAALTAGASEVERVDFDSTVSLDTLVAERIPAFIELISSENLSITLTGEASGIAIGAQAHVIWQEKLAVTVSLTIGNKTIYVCYGETVRVILPELKTQITCTAEEVNGLLKTLLGESESEKTDYAGIAATILDLLGGSKAENGEFRLNLTKYIEGCEVAFSLAANGELTASVEKFTYADIALQATLSLTSGEGKAIAIPDTADYTVVTYKDGKAIYDFVNKCISEGWKVAATVENIAIDANYDQNGNIRVSVTAKAKAKAKAQTLTLVYDKTANRVAILTGNLALSVGVEQVKAFVESFLSQEETPTTAETVSQAVQTILSLDWEKITVTNDGQIVIQIAVDDLLQGVVKLKNCDLTVGATGKELTAELTYEELTLIATLTAGASEVERVDFENTVSLDTLVAERLPAFIELISSENLSITLTGGASGISVHAQASVIWQEELAVTVRLTIENETIYLCYGEGVRVILPELNTQITCMAEEVNGLLNDLFGGATSGEPDYAEIAATVLEILGGSKAENGEFRLNLTKYIEGCEVAFSLAANGELTASVEKFTYADIALQATLALTSGEGKEITLPETENYTVVTYKDGKAIYDFVNKCISEGWKVAATVENIAIDANYDKNGNIRVSVTAKAKAKAKAQTLTLVYDKTANRVAILTGNLALSVGVEQVKAFVESFLSQSETLTTAETVSQAVQTILSLDWNKITVTNDGQIIIQIAVDDLLSDFVTLEDCDLTIGATGKELTAELTYEELTLRATLTAGASEVEKVNFDSTVSLDTLVAERIPAFIKLISSENLSITLTGEASGIEIGAQACVNRQEKLAVTVKITIEEKDIYLCYGENGVCVILPELKTQITCTAEEVNGLLKTLLGESESEKTDYAGIAATVLDLLGTSKVENGEFRLNLTKYVKDCEVAFSLSANGELTAKVDEFTYSDIALQATLTLSSGEGKVIAIPDTADYTVITYEDGKEIYDFVAKCISEGAEVNFTYEGIAATLLIDKNGTMLVTLDMGGKTIELWCDLAEEEKKVIFSVDQVHMKIELDDLYAFLRGAAQEVYGEGEQAESVAAQMTALVKEILNKDILSLFEVENTQDALSLRVAIHELLNAFEFPMQGEALLEVSFVRSNTPHLCVQLQMDGLEKPVSLRLYRAGGRTVMPVAGDIIDLNREDVSFNVTFDSYLDGNSAPRFHVSASVQMKNGNMKDGNWVVEENGQRLTLLEQFKRLYLAIDLTLTRGEGATEADDDLYMKITVAEGDLYVSASRYADGVAEKKPLRLSIGTQELGEILGVACKLLGVETDFFDEFLKGNEVFQNKLSAFIGDGIDLKGVLQELIFSALTSSGEEEGAAASVSELILKNLNYNGITPNIPSESEYISASDALNLVEMLVNTAVYQPQGEENYAVKTSYHVEGQINASLGSLSLEKVPTQIGVEILENEKGEVSGVDINIHLTIGYFFGAINADTETTITVHIPLGGESKVLISRTTTEGLIFKKDYTIVREMSLDYFFSHIKAQLKFILNTSSLINSQIGEDGDSSESAPNTLDYGNYLETFAQTNGGFHIVLNGHNLTNGILGDLDLTIGYGGDNTLNRLQFKTNISVLNLSADLSYPSASENFVPSLDHTQLFAEKVNLPTEVDGKKLDYWEYHVTNGKLLDSHYETPSIAITFDTSGLPAEGYKRKGDSYQKTVSRDLGSVYELPAIEGTVETAEGKKYFMGWSTDGRKENILSEITVPLEGVTLYAVWGDVYTTTVVYGDREDRIIEVLDTNTQEIVLAEDTVISVDQEKYLVGWILSDGREVAPNFSFLPSGNLTATAIWKDITITLVTEYPLDGKTEIVLSEGVKYGESYALGYQNTLTEDGEYLLAYWTTAPNGAGERVETVIPVAGNITVYAYWKNAKTYYNVTIDLGAGTLTEKEGTLWEAKTYDRLLAESVVLPKTGQFSADGSLYLYAWTDGEMNYPKGGAVTPTSETVTYTAIWKKVYTLSVESEYGKSYQKKVVEDIDNTLTLEEVETLFEGRKILSAWTWNTNSAYDTTKSITVLEDVAFTATWVDYYKIVYYDSFNTQVKETDSSGTTGTYTLRGTPADPAKAAENERYTFLGWWLERDGAWIQATSDNLAPGSTTLTAMWAKVKYDGSLSGSDTYKKHYYTHSIKTQFEITVSYQIADKVTCDVVIDYKIEDKYISYYDRINGQLKASIVFEKNENGQASVVSRELGAENLKGTEWWAWDSASWTYTCTSRDFKFNING